MIRYTLRALVCFSKASLTSIFYYYDDNSNVFYGNMMFKL